jgi:hypothetical protein
MADKKISQLTGASTPLAGTEVLPIVQGGATVKVSVADLTAGRAVSAASLTPSGSTIPTNGFYLPSADTVGVATASTIRGIVSSTGNFGFGVATPQYRLDVFNQSAANNFQASFGLTMASGNWTGVHIGYKETNNTDYRKGAIAFEMVDNDARGTVHILNNGAASAASATLADSKFSVAYGGNVTVSTGNLVFGTTAKGITTGSAIPLGFGVNNTVTAMTIDTSSNVGIGTTAPDIFGRFYTRSVGINSAGTTVLQINGTTYGAVDLGFNGTRTATMLAETGGFYIQTTNASNMYLLTNGLERMRIESGGNVGIGAAPAATALLDVQSTTKGVRFPNMTTGQKTAITPSAGTVIFDTDLAKLCVYSGAAWQTITSV